MFTVDSVVFVTLVKFGIEVGARSVCSVEQVALAVGDIQ